MGNIKQAGLVMLLSATFSSMAFADLTDQILKDIRSHKRSIRPEVTSLKNVPVPEPSNLYRFVQDKQKAIELGKALFWDMQVGSDGVQACASCHFNAGADNRVKNELSPGLKNANQDASANPDNYYAPDKGANYHLGVNDFPFHVKSNPAVFNSQVVRDTNDVVSSQGVHYSQAEPGPVIPEYAFEATPYSWIDATSGSFYTMTGGGSAQIPVGFNFRFYGDLYDKVTISANGRLVFQKDGYALGGSGENRSIPRIGGTNGFIAPFWDDLNPSYVRGVYTLLEGVAPNRRLTVTWYKLPHYDNVDLITPGTTTFQAALYEGVNDMVFRYQDMDFGVTAFNFGASATVGVEYLDGSFGTQYSFNEPVIRDGMALRVHAKPTPVPAIVSQSDPDGFQVGGINTRRVEPRNTPTVINAVFNYRQFWDGRASNTFNGVNPFGDNDPYAFVYRTDDFERLVPVRVGLDNASLASQAVAPPISSLEMSTDGRTWREIGQQFLDGNAELPRETCRRMVGLRPLAHQTVDPNDSVLGHLSAYPQPGLTVRDYTTMIQQAFRVVWWWSDEKVRINADGSRSIGYGYRGENSFSQMDMNFSLFFGIAIQLYEATLVSDDSPVDRYLDGDKTALNQTELVGFHIADVEGRCLNCHGRGEFTFASVSQVIDQGLTRVRRGDLIDEGFNNIGVRPTLEDLGVGGVDPFGNPLSFARRTHLTGINYDKLEPLADQLSSHLGADGAFKIPTLRNVELTAPYFHNGGEATLEDVIDFYFRGGNFRRFGINPDNESDHPHPVIGYDARRVNESEITGLGILSGPLVNSGPGVDDPGKGLDDADRASLVAFLKALTDERVRYSQAPFDHPQLFIPNGHPGDQFAVTDDGTGNATDALMEIPAVGAQGGPPLRTFMENLAN